MELLGVSDVATLLDEPEHVVAAACSRFAGYVPMVRIGRDRWYPSEAIPVLRVIFDQIRVGVPDEHIETVLAKRFPVTQIASQGLTGTIETRNQQPDQREERAIQVREVFDRYQSSIQNEMTQMRREIAQLAPQAVPPPIPKPDVSLSELARQSESYLDPRAYGFVHRTEQQAHSVAPEPASHQEYAPPPAAEPTHTPAPEQPDNSFAGALSDEAKTVLSAISRQAAAAETSAIRNEVTGLRDDLSELTEEFRAFTQQLGFYSEPQHRAQAATGTHGPAPTRLEVVPTESNPGGQATDQSNGLLGQLTRRNPRRMGRSGNGDD